MDYEGFKAAVFKLTSIDLNAYKEQQMKRRIDTLISRNKISGYEDFVKALKADKELFEEFVSYLTINVSEFYRNPEQWELMDKQFIPMLIEKFGKNLKIWSAACSTGDEPYSLVMALSRHLPLNQIKIIATDIDKQILAQAKVGIYNEKSIASVPKDLRDKYFTKIGNSYQISNEIKSRVDFRQHNLIKDPYPDKCDFIICRNVLIYFTEEAKDDVFRKFCKSLKTGGFLFIGSTEQIMNHREMGYERKNSFYYEKAI
ncbi:MAG: protein-glutamate O-methyltransferase CheR [Lachnospiraceae bacterium]|jgi:chemotaxis protein methyltransferase CheR|nr:protein-glutamate O-methyltransferase CheR [Lachnospiraceae bacterium]MCI6331721.1 protein-glutamate O-methyltransferase CheR [Lachnospiraceae bacterium]MCI6408608.1 protein-glutamate O-methyltransferase CheR [Lachnospiraceae bacterium]MCI6664967.1 protein-glutamate O-methyltransferase CheR [Lachnospiraceae bacterium]MCI6977864.1 protein-glutamate O-methyltransferase CheR [Lachnospiraceae bacterium]